MKELPNCNLYVNGAGLDANGNWCVRVSFPNSRAFSIQTNGVLPETHSITQATKSPKKLSEDELAKIGEEVCAYVSEHGSANQKSRLKMYKEKGGSFFSKLKSAGKKAAEVTASTARKIHKVAKPHVKKAYKIGKQKAKEAYHSGKEAVKDKIHDTQKGIALKVIDETIDQVKSNSEFMHLKAAEEIIEDKFVRTPEKMAKGGDLSDTVDAMIAKLKESGKSSRLIKLSDRSIREVIQKNKNNDGYSRYWLAANGDKSTARKQNEYLTEDEVRNHWMKSVAESRTQFQKGSEQLGKGGRISTNEKAIESFLTTHDEIDVNNITTHFNQYDNEMLLRQYGTLIATRKGNNVKVTSQKYSKTTTTLSNAIVRMAEDKGLNVERVAKFEEGGSMNSNEEVWEGFGVKKSKFDVGDKVFNYQNKDYAAEIIRKHFSPWTSPSEPHENDTWKYQLKLDDGSQSRWTDEGSVFSEQQKEYAEGGEIVEDSRGYGNSLLNYILGQ